MLLARRTGRAPHSIARDWTSAEIAELAALDRIAPPEDGYWRTALLCHVLHNLWGDPKHPTKIADFLPVPAAEAPTGKPAPQDALHQLDDFDRANTPSQG